MGARLMPVILGAAVLSACTSVGQVGLMTRPTSDAGAIVREARNYREIGPAEGRSCRYFVLGVIPFGDSTAVDALDDALQATGGNALLNATIETSLYGFIPIYNIVSFTCTTVRGIAISVE